MDRFIDYFIDYFKDHTNVVQVAEFAALALVVLGTLSTLSSRAFRRGKIDRERAILKAEYKTVRTTDAASAPQKTIASKVARERAVKRLDEAKEAMEDQTGSAKTSKISDTLLTVGQYVIGGVLASSFVQESLSPKSVGLLGVLVLVASLVKQQFHPELKAEEARKRASKLQALIRTSEDQLTILDAKIASGQDQSDAMIALLTQITQRLTAIENPEALEPKSEIASK
jgi:hypothetical protein